MFLYVEALITHAKAKRFFMLLSCLFLFGCETTVDTDSLDSDGARDAPVSDIQFDSSDSDSSGVETDSGVDTSVTPELPETDVSGATCDNDSFCSECPVGVGECGVFLDCVVGCDDVATYDRCETECGQNLIWTGAIVLVDMLLCGIENSCLAADQDGEGVECKDGEVFVVNPGEPPVGCMDVACLRTHCRSYYTGCFSGCEIRSCVELKQCVEQCEDDDPLTEPDENEDCVWNDCRRPACASAQSKYDHFVDATGTQH